MRGLEVGAGAEDEGDNLSFHPYHNAWHPNRLRQVPNTSNWEPCWNGQRYDSLTTK